MQLPTRDLEFRIRVKSPQQKLEKQMILKCRLLLALVCKIPGVFSFLINPIIRTRVSPKGQSVRVKLFGCIFILNLSDYTQRKAWLKAFETKEIRFLQTWLRPGDVAVDVGANVGLLTIPMAKASGEKGKVFAFEPIEENVRSLKSNLDVNNISQCCAYQLRSREF